LRPVLKPALRRLWRTDAAMQLGADPVHGVVLHGVDATADAVLALLDGTRDADEIVAAAAGDGVPEPEARALLDLLGSVHVLDDAAAAPHGLDRDERRRLEPDLATLTLLTTQPGAGVRCLDGRRAATVLVVGAGRVGSLTASLLAAAGVGHVAIRDDRAASAADAVPGGLTPLDDGHARAIAAMAAAQRAGGASVDGAVRPPDATDCRTADLAVVVNDCWTPPPAELLDLFAIAGLPYLLTGIRETYGVVGPLVLPGRTSCPRCHDLHRAERDPCWPVIAAQLATDARGGAPACDVTLAAGVAALTAGQVLAHLLGPGLTRSVDATLELRLPEWTVRRRAWTPHGECPCGAAETNAADRAAVRAAALEAELARIHAAGGAARLVRAQRLAAEAAAAAGGLGTAEGGTVSAGAAAGASGGAAAGAGAVSGVAAGAGVAASTAAGAGAPGAAAPAGIGAGTAAAGSGAAGREVAP
jgi:hypothetical protein